MIGIGTILSIAGGVSQAINIYKFVSTLARGSDAERVLGALDRIHAQVERLNDNILYAPGIEGLSPIAGAVHRIHGLREAREILEPVQMALGGEIVSSGLIETPDRMERAMLENPWAVLEDIRPQALAVRHANPDKAPVLFVHQGVRYIGWQMRGALPVLFNCELRDLPGLGASLTPEVLDKLPVSSLQANRLRPAWASKAGEDKFGWWAEFALGDVLQRMRWIKPGVFTMGSPEGEADHHHYEGPQHEVRLTKGFWLGDTPVTQSLWTAAMENNPSHFRDPKRPVETVSWYEVQQFLNKMNARIPGLRLGLPTEAQWEYACRASTNGPNYAGDAGKLADIAWFNDNSGGKTHPAGMKRCNDWGLYDMLGNVWEWCADGMRSYTVKPVADPVGPLDDDWRAVRGGSWGDVAGFARAAFRCGDDNLNGDCFSGFRCCA